MLYICADDYGITEKSSARIRECAENGALNKISILANTGMKNPLEKINSSVALSLHLNLVEGKPVSPPEAVSLLIDERGYFKYSFIGLFFLSLTPKRRELKRQIYTELKNQLALWQSMIAPDMPLEIDSHQHTNMIPAVFDSLMRVLSDEGIKPDYLRMPSEPVMPYIKAAELWRTYKPINILKQFTLNLLGLINRRKFKKSKIKTALFMGVLFSGNMDKKRVERILPYYKELAKRKNSDIEVLFHPGYINEGEEVFDTEKKSFNEFYFSCGRKTEYNALKELQI